MPPKKKKSTKKSKKKKASTVRLSFKEVVMAKQLQIKELQIIDMKKYLEESQLQNARQKQKNLFLLKEQNLRLRDVVAQAFKIAKEEEAIDSIPYKKVEEALAEKFNAMRIEDNRLEEMGNAIAEIDQLTKEFAKNLEQLKKYQAEGQFIDERRIEDLLHEIDDMEASYKEIEKFFQHSFSTYKHVVTKQNEENLSKHKKQASESAFSNLEKQTELEFLDNRWLLKEVDIHRQHIINVSKELEALERTNIDLISSLFNQNYQESWVFYQKIQSYRDSKEMRYNEEKLEQLTCKDSSEKVDMEPGLIQHVLPSEASLCVLGTKLPLYEWKSYDEDESEKNNFSSTLKDNI